MNSRLQQGSQHRPISGAAAIIATSLEHRICSTLISPTKKCAHRRNSFYATLLRDLSVQALHHHVIYEAGVQLSQCCSYTGKLSQHITVAVPDFQACNAINNSAKHWYSSSKSAAQSVLYSRTLQANFIGKISYRQQ